MRRKSVLHTCWISCLILGLVGCSKYAPVEGVLLLDGQPVGGATLMFIPKEKGPPRGGPRQANAYTREDGTFSLETVNDAGAIPAVYIVVANKKVPAQNARRGQQKNRAGMQGGAGQLVETLPAKYTKRESSDLELEVTSSGFKDLEINMYTEGGK